MIAKLIHDFKQRRIQKEFELLELEEMAAHANAELGVVKAQRALEDAKVRQERAKDDAQMVRRWEEAKLRIQQKYLENPFTGDYGLPEPSSTPPMPVSVITLRETAHSTFTNKNQT